MDYKIIYNEYSGTEKRAVDLLSREAGKYLTREEGVYRLYVLPVEKEGAPLGKNAFIVGVYGKSPLISRFIGENEIKDGGFAVKVVENPNDEDGRLIIITAKESKNLFYAAASFIYDYIPLHAPRHGQVKFPKLIFDEPLPTCAYSEAPRFSVRSVFTWGHPINDYMKYIDDLAKLRFNRLIIWNDFMPVNMDEVIDYAHSYGIEVFGGFAWGWIDGCNKITDISDERLSELKKNIIAEYERVYATSKADGIYFQSFTERGDEYIGGRLIAEAVTTLVNQTAEVLLATNPELKIQFGLHASSVKNRLAEIARVDERVEILWEDCGSFPYDYTPVVKSEEDFQKTVDFTREILSLRGGKNVGLVFKGVMMLDWTKFVNQSGPFVLGRNAEEISAHDKRLRRDGWRIFSAEWLKYGEYAHRMLKIIGELCPDAETCLAGSFDGGIWLPEALAADMFYTDRGGYDEVLMKVAMRAYIDN